MKLTMTKLAEENLNYVLATFAIEGLVPSKEAQRLCAERSDGKISYEDGLQQLLTKYRKQTHGVL